MTTTAAQPEPASPPIESRPPVLGCLMLVLIVGLVIWGVSAALTGGAEPSAPAPASSDLDLSQAGCYGAEQTLQNLLDELNATGTMLAPNVVAEMRDAEAMMALHAANTPDPGAATAIAASGEHLTALLATIAAADGDALIAEARRSEHVATDLGLACAVIGAPLSLD